MYCFERYMGHLKKKVKNKAKVEGSIVEQYINEEISTFCTYYFEPHIKTKHRTGDRHYDGGNQDDTHEFDGIPDIFSQAGRGSGKEIQIWLQDRDYHIAHTYILQNCDQLRSFERLFDESMIATNPGITENNLTELREKTYSSWLQKHVEDTLNNNSYPNWLLSLAHGPMVQVTSWPMYFCRGYMFHTYDHGKDKKNANYGVCVKGVTPSSSSEEAAEFYGVLKEIYELHYPGPVDLKVVVFKCDWYDSTIGKGIRKNKSGIIDINAKRHYQKYDPFVLASQADQVCYVPYPRMTQPKKINNGKQQLRYSQEEKYWSTKIWISLHCNMITLILLSNLIHCTLRHYYIQMVNQKILMIQY
ncbi:PREDICTED: uncharacterized protein LOC109130114 [Camelina sativa]|uniref:Uncharacterized protein LOC109126558 n=1 Tax=Camelina sativa TaxID=90675 RepID=A0ABM1QG89_CAMSA|nr:PREDICTED: uncharacterized protein LOC109126558 [Camelina sativa]XP_019094874.1 PREDICTED: uncharacterized protein LOC109130114 [Camelina sativa]